MLGDSMLQPFAVKWILFQLTYTFQFCCYAVDASRAGAGNLEIIVSVGSENIPNFVNADGGGRFRVTFTPIKPETHNISIKFNGDPVPGKYKCLSLKLVYGKSIYDSFDLIVYPWLFEFCVKMGIT